MTTQISPLKLCSHYLTAKPVFGYLVRGRTVTDIPEIESLRRTFDEASKMPPCHVAAGSSPCRPCAQVLRRRHNAAGTVMWADLSQLAPERHMRARSRI